MGQVNWLAVIVAAMLAVGVLWLVWRGKGAGRGNWMYLLQIVPAAMLGHSLARIGAEKLAAKPQLYALQSGGLALAIVIPALWMTHMRNGGNARDSWRDSAAFLIAYLAMGAVFWLIA